MACVTVAYGRTQVGKSSTLGSLRRAGQPAPRVGDGDGESVTERTLLLDTEVGPCLDAPGLDDNRMRFTDEEAGRRVAVGVAASGADRVKFLVFESLAADSMQLRGTLERLSRAFGAAALRAALVVATKADMLGQPARRERRLNLIRQVVQEQGLQGLITWQNEDVEAAARAEQLSSLQGALAGFEGVATADLQDLRDRQRARAQQLCDAHPTQTRLVDVDVEETYTEPREVQEPYQEPYVETVDYTEWYDAPETYDGTQQVEYQYEKGVGGLLGLFGVTHTRTGHKDVQVQKVRMVRKSRPATREVTRYRTAHRPVTHYDVRSRWVTQQTTAEYRLPVEHFLDAALAEVIEEVRRSLTPL